ncbi:hypothetical protein [uncultured Kocuria sp.]|uniref:hypothetical protein n=1 Tax=uncultured Kocuria sp. TaxID=259305 RepID=UPI00262681E8|nr:hypothetical protein [uncultured Kocuria sp.]
MNESNYESAILIKAARAAAEAFLAELDRAAGAPPGEAAEGQAGVGDPVEYDPLHDEPPFPRDVGRSATSRQRQMATITYLGAIGRLNAEEGRGASSKEITEFAKKAGYLGGNAVNGWNSRPGSPRAVEIVDGARFLNDEALTSIKKDAAKLGIKLVGEFATVPKPE